MHVLFSFPLVLGDLLLKLSHHLILLLLSVLNLLLLLQLYFKLVSTAAVRVEAVLIILLLDALRDAFSLVARLTHWRVVLKPTFLYYRTLLVFSIWTLECLRLAHYRHKKIFLDRVINNRGWLFIAKGLFFHLRVFETPTTHALWNFNDILFNLTRMLFTYILLFKRLSVDVLFNVWLLRLLMTSSNWLFFSFDRWFYYSRYNLWGVFSGENFN